MDDALIRASLIAIEPAALAALRRALIAEQPDRDALAERLLRVRADGIADLIDFLTINPNSRRQVVRLLAEIEANG